MTSANLIRTIKMPHLIAAEASGLFTKTPSARARATLPLGSSLCRAAPLRLSLMDGERSRFLMRLRIVPLPSAAIAPLARVSCVSAAGAAPLRCLLRGHAVGEPSRSGPKDSASPPLVLVPRWPGSASYFSASAQEPQHNPDQTDAPPASRPRGAARPLLPVWVFTITHFQVGFIYTPSVSSRSLK